MTLDPKAIRKKFLENVKKNQKKVLIIKDDIDKYFENVFLKNISEEYGLSDREVDLLRKEFRKRIKNDEKFMKDIFIKIKDGKYVTKDDFKIFVLKKLPDFYIKEMLSMMLDLKKIIPNMDTKDLKKMMDIVKASRKVYEYRAKKLLNKTILDLYESYTSVHEDLFFDLYARDNYEDVDDYLRNVSDDVAKSKLKYISLMTFIIILAVVYANSARYMLEYLVIRFILKETEIGKFKMFLKAIITTPDYMKYLVDRTKKLINRGGVLGYIGAFILITTMYGRVMNIVIVIRYLYLIHKIAKDKYEENPFTTT